MSKYKLTNIYISSEESILPNEIELQLTNIETKEIVYRVIRQLSDLKQLNFIGECND